MGKTILVFALLHDPPAHAGKKEPRTNSALGYDGQCTVRDEGKGLSFT